MSKAKEREFIFNRYNGKCAFCGIDLEKGWHISPLIPTELAITNEGNLEKTNNEIENKLPSCRACNSSRIQLSYGEKTMTVEEFKKSLWFSFNQMLKNNPDYKKAVRFGLIKETQQPITFYFETINNK